MLRAPLALQRWKIAALFAATVVTLAALRGWSDGQNPARVDPAPKAAQPPADAVRPDGWVRALAGGNLAPANMGGRFTAVAVYEADPSLYYVATASGGLLKTVNNGISFEHQFDREATVSIGDVCVAQSNPN